MLEDAVNHSVVIVGFNRQLTWAERETFRNFGLDFAFTWKFQKDTSRVCIESYFDSREIVDILSDFVEKRYLNVHPVSVKTVEPKEIV